MLQTPLAPDKSARIREHPGPQPRPLSHRFKVGDRVDVWQDPQWAGGNPRKYRVAIDLPIVEVLDDGRVVFAGAPRRLKMGGVRPPIVIHPDQLTPAATPQEQAAAREEADRQMQQKFADRRAEWAANPLPYPTRFEPVAPSGNEITTPEEYYRELAWTNRAYEALEAARRKLPVNPL